MKDPRKLVIIKLVWVWRQQQVNCTIIPIGWPFGVEDAIMSSCLLGVNADHHALIIRTPSFLGSARCGSIEQGALKKQLPAISLRYRLFATARSNPVYPSTPYCLRSLLRSKLTPTPTCRLSTMQRTHGRTSLPLCEGIACHRK